VAFSVDSCFVNIDVCCRDYMDRFLDEQESPATLDRVSLPAVSAVDSEQATGQQQVVGFPADDNTSCSQLHNDGEPVILHEGGRDMKPCVANGDSLTVDTTDKVEILSTAELSAGEAARSTADSVFVKLDTDTDTASHSADATLRSPDDHNNIDSNVSETNKSASILPSVCDEAQDGMRSNNEIEDMVTEKTDTAYNDSAAVLKKEISSTDVDEVISEPSEAAALSSSGTVVAASDQQGFHDDKSVSNSYCTRDEENRPTSASVSQDVELLANTMLRESPTTVSCAPAAATGVDIDEVKPDDVELLLAAVDSATSVGGSLYSNVDPLTAALEFSSSANISTELLSNKTNTDSVCHQATNSSMPSNSQVIHSPTSESAVLSQSSTSPLLPISSSSVVPTSCLPANCADLLKQDDGCKSDVALVSSTPDVMHDMGKDIDTSVYEAPVTIVPSSTSDMLVANQDVLLPDETVDGNRPHTVHDEAAVSSLGEDNVTVALDNIQCPTETEFASLSSNQSTESCLQSNRTAAACVSSNMQADSTDAVGVDCANTDPDSVSLSLASGDVTLPDKLAEQPCSLDESEHIDSRSLLTVTSDSDCASSAS